MKKPSVDESSLEMSDELRAYLDTFPVFTDEDRAALAKAAEKLEDDLEFQADLLKMRFLEQIMQRMAALGISRSRLARLWKKTRQYVSGILDREKPKNFTFQTAAELAHLLGCRVEICVVAQKAVFRGTEYRMLGRASSPLILWSAPVASDCGEAREDFQGFEPRKLARKSATEHGSLSVAA